MARKPMDKRKRARQQAEDGAAAAATAAEPEPANDAAPEDVENSEAKRAKIDDTVVAKDDSGAEDAVAKGTNAPGGGREGKKRKVAMLLAYCGAGYQGMQRNPGAITIEGELEQALFRANAIAQCNFGDMRKVDWMRAARTDKGVSAIGQIVSARLVIDPPGLVERVNQHLPKDIRVFGYTRVTSNFNAKQMCDKRRYEYLVPVFAFDPHAHHDRETMNTWNERKENVRLQRIEKRKALEQKEADAKDVTNEALQAKASEGEVQTVEEVTMKEVVETEVTEASQPKTSEEGEVQTVEEVTLVEVTEASQAKASEGEVQTVEEVTVVVKEVVETDVTEALQPKTSEEGEVQTVEEVTMKEVVETKVADASQPKKTSEEGEVQTVEEVTMVEVTEASQAKASEGEVETVAEVTMVEVTEASQAKASEGEVQTVEEVTTVVKEVVETEVEETGEREPFVFDEAKLQRLNDVLSRYKGTHNFHNFTARIKPEDPSAKRYILSFEAGKVIEVQGTQFVPCTVVGQSFMLHQIRKMIGTAIAIMRGCVPETIIDFALRRENDVNTPMAPELGLFLDECYYTAYNKRFGKSHAELTQTGYEEMIQKFKHEVIYPHIATREAKDGTMALWLHSLNDRHYPYFETHRAASKN